MKDLWSLVKFLGIEPFTDRQWWTRTIERPLLGGDKSALGYDSNYTEYMRNICGIYA